MANEKISEIWTSGGEDDNWIQNYSDTFKYSTNVVQTTLTEDGQYKLNVQEDISYACSYLDMESSAKTHYPFMGLKVRQGIAGTPAGEGIIDHDCSTEMNDNIYVGIMHSGRRSSYEFNNNLEYKLQYRNGEGVTSTSEWYPFWRNNQKHILSSFVYKRIILGYDIEVYNPTNHDYRGITTEADYQRYKDTYPIVKKINIYPYFGNADRNSWFKQSNAYPYIVFDNTYNGDRIFTGRNVQTIVPYFRSNDTEGLDRYITCKPEWIMATDNFTNDYGNPYMVNPYDTEWFGTYEDSTYSFDTESYGMTHPNVKIHGLKTSKIKEYMAQFGYICRLGTPSSFNMSTPDEATSLNEVTETGLNTGNTSTGSDIVNLPNYNADDIKIDITVFIDTNNYTEKITLEEPTINITPHFSTFWAFNPITLGFLKLSLFPVTASAIEELEAGTKAYGSSPVDVVRSFRVFPFDLTEKFPEAFDTGTPNLGAYSTGISDVPKLNDLKKCIINVGSFVVPPKYNDWRDTDQYVKIQIYLPYIGSTEISYQQNLKKKISIKYIIDVTSGVCEAIISADDRIISQGLSGQIGFDMSIAGDNVVSYSAMQRQAKQMELQRSQQTFNDTIGIIKSVGNVKQNVGSALIGALTGNPSAGGNVGNSIMDAGSQIVNAGFNRKRATNEIDWAHQQAESLAPISAGVSGTLADLMGVQNVIVTFIYSQFEYPELEDKRSGGVVYKSAKLEDLKGFVKCHNALLRNVSSPSVFDANGSFGVPTTEDLEELRDILNEGIYIGTEDI